MTQEEIQAMLEWVAVLKDVGLGVTTIIAVSWIAVWLLKKLLTQYEKQTEAQEKRSDAQGKVLASTCETLKDISECTKETTWLVRSIASEVERVHEKITRLENDMPNRQCKYKP